MTPLEAELANRIFDSGIVSLQKTRIRIHDVRSDLLDSPFYFNCRGDRHTPPGPMTEELLSDLATALKAKLTREGISFGWMAGIPNAGTPIAFALGNILPQTPVAWIQKTDAPTPEWMRGQLNMNSPEIQRAAENTPGILVDDVIGAATTKHKWLPPFQALGIHLAALAVLLDREEGGAEIIEEKFDISVVPLFRSSTLMKRYADSGRLTEVQYQEILRYRLLVERAAEEFTPRVS